MRNARAAAELGVGGLERLLWSFAPDPAAHARPRTLADVPATSPASTAMAKELKKRGFAFVGPTTAYALMQATGMVDDHLVGCIASDSGKRRTSPRDKRAKGTAEV
jgi:DNA-3-methyladenine glycosylase I